jgi:hypothetical protein
MEHELAMAWDNLGIPRRHVHVDSVEVITSTDSCYGSQWLAEHGWPLYNCSMLRIMVGMQLALAPCRDTYAHFQHIQ